MTVEETSRRYNIPAEWIDWYQLSPQQRWQETTRLWQTFHILGGTLDPEPDTESPFFDAKSWRAKPAHGRAGMRVLRSCGI
jgi:hypothetical protein